MCLRARHDEETVELNSSEKRTTGNNFQLYKAGQNRAIVKITLGPLDTCLMTFLMGMIVYVIRLVTH